MRRVLVLLLAGLIQPVLAFSFYPSGHLATSVQFDESYIDFGNYTVQASGLLEFSPEIHAELGLYYQPDDVPAPIAWIDYVFVKALRLQVGRFPVPFGAFNELNAPHNNYMATTPHICHDAVPTPWVDWGARIQWMQKMTPWETFCFTAYVCNGLGEGLTLRESRQLTDNNSSNGFGTRISLSSARAGELGLSGYFGARDALNQINLALVGADLHSRIGFFELRGEYVAGFLEFPEGLLTALQQGVNYLMPENQPEEASWTCGAYVHTAFHISRFVVPSLRMDIIGYRDIETGSAIIKQRLGLGFAIYPIEPLMLKLEMGLADESNYDGLQLEPVHLQIGISL